MYYSTMCIAELPGVAAGGRGGGGVLSAVVSTSKHCLLPTTIFP